MTLQYVSLPLFEDEDYSYAISLEGNAYTFRIYYNARSALWYWDLSLEDGQAVILGEALVPNYPIGIDYAFSSLSGFFWMEQISTKNVEKYKSEPRLISQYYKLFYVYDDGE